MKNQAIQGTARLQLVESLPSVTKTVPPFMEFYGPQQGHPRRHNGGFVDDSPVPESLFTQSSFLVLGVNFSNSVAHLYTYHCV